jgi:hypothetical protein
MKKSVWFLIGRPGSIKNEDIYIFAGKSALIKVLSGVYSCGDYEGRIEVNGKRRFLSMRGIRLTRVSPLFTEKRTCPCLYGVFHAEFSDGTI